MSVSVLLEGQQDTAVAEALLKARGKSVLLKNFYGPSETAIWTGLVTRLNGMRDPATGKELTLVCLLGGGQVFADISVAKARELLMTS